MVGLGGLLRQGDELGFGLTTMLLIAETRGILDTDTITSLVVRVKRMIWNGINWSCDLAGLTSAASLAHQKLFGSVNRLTIRNVDLTSVPDEHLASLISCVTYNVYIDNVSGCDLVTFLDSAKSKTLHITRQSLCSQETQALARAMESGVEEVDLNGHGGGSTMTPDMLHVMTGYNGQGKCKVMKINNIARQYREELKTWAKSRNWTVTNDVVLMTVCIYFR